MASLQERLVTLLGQGPAADWAPVIAPNATYDTLAESLSGADAVIRRLVGMTQFAGHEWQRLDVAGPGPDALVLKGTPPAGSDGRTFVLTFRTTDGPQDRIVTAIGQQFFGLPSLPATAMAMDDGMRRRFDRALADQCPMYLTYVDRAGRPQMSMRGSLLTLGPDSLGLWARAATNIADAITANPYVALIYRDPQARATYTLAGRASIAADEATRSRIWQAMPVPEQRHDFAHLGTALVIDLDRVAGQAGYSTTGPIDPVHLVRGG